MNPKYGKKFAMDPIFKAKGLRWIGFKYKLGRIWVWANVD